MMKRLGILMTIGPLAACTHSGAAPGAPAARFLVPDEVVIAPASGIGPRLSNGRIEMPRYPADARARRMQAAPVVAYVLDTAGIIEPGTLTFLSSEPGVFRRAICEWAPLARFDRLMLDGRARRALVVMSFSFYVTENPLERRERSDVERMFVERLRQMPRDDAFALLERSPHC